MGWAAARPSARSEVMRIVSLCPSITETLIALGLADSLAGVTRFCIHPAEVVRDLPKVGGTKDPDLEAILRAAPELVLMNEEENRREDFERLSSALRVETSLPKRVAEVPGELRRLGALTGTEAVAEVHAQALEAALAELAGGRPFGYAYLIWKKPWMAVGGDTYVSDLFGLVGGENVFAAAADRYPAFTLEELAARRPEVVLLPDEPYPFKPAHQAELAEVLPEARIELVSGDDCCWHGVRSIRGVRLALALAKVLAGG